jgi:hypothetical protein
VSAGRAAGNLRRRLLRPLARLAAADARAKCRQFDRACRGVEAQQRQWLAGRLAEAASSDFAREHRFDRIDSYEAFASAVPVRSYEKMRDRFTAVFQGRPQALLGRGERVLMFSMTSGTTGEPKYIPVTRGFLADIRRGWNVFGLRLLEDHPDAWLRSILQLSSSMHERTSPTGLPCGAISGLLAATQKRIVRRMYAAPRWTAELHGSDAKPYAQLRFALMRDVAILTTANPSSAIRLVEVGREHFQRLLKDLADGTCRPPGAEGHELCRRRLRPQRLLARRLGALAERDGGFLPRHAWDLSVLCNWTGGTLGLYLPRLRELYGEVPIRDIGLLASEGRFTVPTADHTPAGAAEMTGNFLEFIPAARRDESDPPVLPAWSVECGEEYFLVVTNRAGLWRYDMDDRVRVVGRRDEAPVLEFLSRGRSTASITGEKITEDQVVSAMRAAAEALELNVDRFELRGRFDETPFYELRVEDVPAPLERSLSSRLDEELARLNCEYASKRSSRRLGPIRPVAVEPGTFARVEAERIRQRNGRAEQYKHVYLYPAEASQSAGGGQEG